VNINEKVKGGSVNENKEFVNINEKVLGGSVNENKNL
jgi:hypothetical protein